MFLRCNGKLLDLSVPVVMGIVNITPDSFYSGSRKTNATEIIRTCETMLMEGASLLDVGGYSTRPGATPVDEEEECRRVTGAVKAIMKAFPDARISVDTFRSNVANAALEEGACMVNDISAGEDDVEMMQLVAQKQVPYIMMHKRGNPQTMSSLTQYTDVVMDIVDYFIQKLHQAREYKLHDIIIDPGFGFAKTMEQNYTLLGKLPLFTQLQKPVLVGISRKQMLRRLLNVDTDEALNGTSVANTIALVKGASILRVHDVKEAIQCVKIVKAISPE